MAVSSIQPDGGISEAQGRRREAGSEGSVEQSRDPMNKNRIRGLPGRTSERVIAKSRAIKGREGKSGGDARRRSVLPREVCAVSGSPGLSGSARPVTAAQKSAEGIVAGSPAKAQTTDRVSRTATLMRTRRQNIQLELALEPVAKGEARSPDTQGTEAHTAHAEPERPGPCRLTPSNRRVRTRTHGGVGGRTGTPVVWEGRSREAPPYPDCATALRELKKIKLAWPDLHYATAKGVLILFPSKPAIAPTTGPQRLGE